MHREFSHAGTIDKAVIDRCTIGKIERREKLNPSDMTFGILIHVLAIQESYGRMNEAMTPKDGESSGATEAMELTVI